MGDGIVNEAKTTINSSTVIDGNIKAEELAGAIHNCAAENKKCSELLSINAVVERNG